MLSSPVVELWEPPTVIKTSKLLSQQTPRGERRQFLYIAVRHSIAELQHRR
jgi:hypothetical protein